MPLDGDETLYPKGVVTKALQQVAYQDEGLIQYKAEVMLRIFEEDVLPLISGHAKAMIVTSSRLAGLRYFQIIQEKLRERGAAYKALYAFSDFVHPDTNATITEIGVNGLKAGELIENRFEGDDYRLMIVASKFQTGFDQPLLAGMFLDKPVLGRNAVQTVSRLNRCHEGKTGVIVVDFTNNAEDILKAFGKYRKGTPFEPTEPNPEACQRQYEELLKEGIFTQQGAEDFGKLLTDGSDAEVQSAVAALRTQFGAKLPDPADRRAFVYALARFSNSFHFFTCFFTFPAEIAAFAAFAEYAGPQLIKEGTVSELMKQIRQTEVVKAAVEFQGEFQGGGTGKSKAGSATKGAGPPAAKVSVQDVIMDLLAKYNISDDEALYIKQVTQEKSEDPIIRETVITHSGDKPYLENTYRGQVNSEIQNAYSEFGRYEELSDAKYTNVGGIFDIMAVTVITHHLAFAV